MSKPPAKHIGRYPWGRRPNEMMTDKYERRRAVLRDHQRDNDLKEQNRKNAWATLWNRRKPLSKHQMAAGARKVI